MSNQQKAIDYGLEQVKVRSTATYQPDVIALVGGGTGLEQNIQVSFEQHGINHRLKYIILDIIHGIF